MATIPSLADGTVLHGSDLALFGPNRPRGVVHQATAQAALATGTWVAVTFDTLDEDKDPTMWTVGAAGYVYLNTPGEWEILAQVTWAPNATGARQIQLRKNASLSPTAGTWLAFDERPSAGASPESTTNLISVSIPGFQAGDSLNLFAQQKSGGPLGFTIYNATSVYLAARWVGGL